MTIDVGMGYELGSADPNVHPFGLNYGVHEKGGYMRFMEREIFSAYKLGYRTFLLHRPYGEPTPHDHMDLDARCALLNRADTTHVVDEFRNMLGTLLCTHDDIRVIVYLGTNSTTLTKLLVHDNRPKEHSYRLVQSLADVLEMDCEVAFDASTDWEENSVYRHWLELVRAYKQQKHRHRQRRVYVEALPVRPWQFEHDCIAEEHVFLNHLRQGNPQGCRLQSDTNTTVRWWTGHMRNLPAPRWMPEQFLLDCMMRPNTLPIFNHADKVGSYMSNWDDDERALYNNMGPAEWVTMMHRRATTLFAKIDQNEKLSTRQFWDRMIQLNVKVPA